MKLLAAKLVSYATIAKETALRDAMARFSSFTIDWPGTLPGGAA
jgi:hypothetical protein